ncbi:MAG: hypothetical protein ACXAC7_02075 [Candidatus Hodarchaeales archaeon]|jgi:ABC-type molybdenum transport system ATPase subunit/photorepair protein PhrA/rubrerythrin
MDYLDYIRNKSTNDKVFLRTSELYEETCSNTKSRFLLPMLNSLVISGLFPFKSDQIIELYRKEKANVIYGGNGAGKTTTINCIEFGLLGAASSLEIKSTFSKRIINRFDVKTNFTIDSKPYLLQRTINPSGDSHHHVSLKRVGEEELISDFPTVEGVRDVSIEFQNLTGITLVDYAKIFDFLTLRVPRHHYLASNIFNIPGAQYRQSLFSKLLGHPIPVKISLIAYKIMNQTKSHIQRIKRRISIIKPLQTVEISSTQDQISETRESFEQDFFVLENKIKELKIEKEELFTRIKELDQKRVSIDPAIHEELAQKEVRLAKLNQFQKEEWICEICENDYSIIAQSRIRSQECPVCGQYADDLAQTLQELQEIGERIDKIRQYFEKVQIRQQKLLQQTENIIKEIQVKDGEIALIENKKREITAQQTVITPSSRTQEVLENLHKELLTLETEEKLYQELYLLTKGWLDLISKEFISKLSKKWAYYQKELFDHAKWTLAPNYSIISEDGQIFKDLSHGEKNLTDMIFRMSVIDVLLELKPSNLFFIVDTPEEGLDAAFYKRFQPLLNEFIKKHATERFIVLTSCERDFVDELSSDNFRLENLLIKSTNSRPFQVRQLKLLKFLQ